MLKFKIGELLAKEQGQKQEHDINTDVEFEGEDDPRLSGPISFHLTFMRLPDAIHAQITNFKTKTECKCARCLKSYFCEIEIPEVEREFYEHKPSEADEEVCFIDMKNSEIDLTEMIRQEILLNSPPIPVCKEECKGLCPNCGKNLNEENCECSKEQQKEGPLSKLKDLFKKN